MFRGDRWIGVASAKDAGRQMTLSRNRRPPRIDRLVDELTSLSKQDRERLLAALVPAEEAITEHRLLIDGLDQLPDEFFLKGLDGRYLFANRETEIGAGAEPGGLVGRNDAAFFDREMADRFASEDAEVVRSRSAVSQPPYRMFEHDGAVSWNQSSKYPVFDEAGRMLAIFGHVRQSTEAMQSRVLLEAQIDVLEMLAANKPSHDIFVKIVRLIEEQLPGYAGSILILDEAGKTVADVVAPSMPDEYSAALVGLEIADNIGTCGTACFRKTPTFTEDILTDFRWDSFRPLAAPLGLRSCWSYPYSNSDGSVLGTFALYSRQPHLPRDFEARCLALGSRLAELTIDRERAAAQIRLMAERDGLTGLPNRAAFRELLSEALAAREGDGAALAVAVIDVDDFKQINDRHGHGTGDAFLAALGERIAGAAGPDDVVARLGADEFALVLQPRADLDFEQALQAILDTLREPVEADNHRVPVSLSAGLAAYPAHGGDVNDLLAHATAALHRAKQQGDNRLRIYDAEFSRQQAQRKEKIADLRNAIASGEIDLDFQPLTDLASGNVFGFEALARWQHPCEGRLGPGAFIALAESEGLIVELGHAVLTKACRQASRWLRDFGIRRTVSVNVSAKQFSGGALRDQVRHALAASGLEPGQLELELTESMLIEDEDKAIAIMGELRSLGISFAIDDFGTGFSNLGALARLPVNRLKIDRSIIRDIETNPAAASIASAIIAMGQRLGLRVLAEGVETVGQLSFLHAEHCDDVQGYLLGRPIPSNDLLDILKAGRPTVAQEPLRAAQAVTGRSLKARVRR